MCNGRARPPGCAANEIAVVHGTLSAETHYLFCVHSRPGDIGAAESADIFAFSRRTRVERSRDKRSSASDERLR
jgi:hypothetical protein